MNINENAFLQNILGRHLPFRERVFRMILLIAGFTDAFALVETLALVGFEATVLPLAILLVAVVVALILTIQFEKHKLAEYIVDFVLIVMVFPEMFFVNGGVHGGAPIWFIISTIYTFLMFSGKGLVIFLTLDVVVDIVVYAVAYYNPQMIQPLESLKSEYMDSLFGVIVVGLALGTMIKFQMRVYEEERAVVEKQNRELEANNEAKDRFFTNMSNEIMTPLNTIIGLNEMILREHQQDDTSENANGIKNASKMLLALVNEILDVSQLESKKIELKQEEYSTLLLMQDINNMMHILLKDTNISFYCDVDENVPAVLRGDQKRVFQVLSNLLVNAQNNTTEGFIAIHLGCTKKSANVVELTFQIEDTGKGIRKEDIDTIFDVYNHQKASRKSDSDATGLGLTISKYLVDLMGGHILVDSIYTKGTIFTVIFEQEVVDSSSLLEVEREYRKRQSLPSEYKQRFEASEARILLVDDDRMDIQVLKKLLAATKIQIDVVKDMDECLQRTIKHFYHVIIVDQIEIEDQIFQIPKAVQRQVNGLCRESAMIAIKADLSGESEKQYLDVGYDVTLAKPVEGTLLEEYILAFLPDDIVQYQSFEVLQNVGMPRKRPIARRKKQVLVTTDCVAELSREMMDKYDIPMMYLYIRTPNGRFADTKEIDTDSIESYLTDESSTAFADSVSIEEYEQFFIEQLDVAEEVVHISMAANAGKSYSVATDAAKALGHVHVVDSGHISCGQTILVLYAASMAQNGFGAQEICKEMERVSKNVETGFIMPSANVFYHNGYTSAMVANICRIAKLRPILTMKRSRLEVDTFEIGKMDHARRRYIQRRLRNKKNINTDVVYISHVGLSAGQLQMLEDEIARHVKFERVVVQKASFSCACNAGMGSFGFAFYRNNL